LLSSGSGPASLRAIAALSRTCCPDYPHPGRRDAVLHNLALDNGVKPSEISEIITHLAFYSGWGNAMSAVLRRRVFARAGVKVEDLAAVSPMLLPLNETAEASAGRER